MFPEWKVHATFVSGHLSEALSLDCKLSSHPIEVDCPDANMINQIFDSLSYAKAASGQCIDPHSWCPRLLTCILAVLRMLSRYVGEADFLKGVSLYLKDHRFGNSVTEDLWAGIQKATGVDIPTTMDNWVKKVRAATYSRLASRMLTRLLTDGFPCDHRYRDCGGYSCSPGPLPGNWTCRARTQRDDLVCGTFNIPRISCTDRFWCIGLSPSVCSQSLKTGRQLLTPRSFSTLVRRQSLSTPASTTSSMLALPVFVSALLQTLASSSDPDVSH